MATLVYDPTINYVRLIQLAGGNPRETELLSGQVINNSITQASLDAALIQYTAGTIPLAESEANADIALDALTLAQAILGDPTALGILATQLGGTRPATVVQNVYAPPAAPTAITTLPEAQAARTAELELAFSSLMAVGVQEKGFQINTSLHNLQRWRASIDLVIYSGFSEDRARDANGAWKLVSKRDMSKIMRTGYSYYRANLGVLLAALDNIAAATSITGATGVTATWV